MKQHNVLIFKMYYIDDLRSCQYLYYMRTKNNF